MAVVMLVLLPLTGCGGKPPQGGPSGGPQEVTVARPLRLKTLDWDPYTGRLAAVESVEVRSRVSGYLGSHHFEEGQIVERGQLLFVIDERPFVAELAQAQATLEESRSKRQQAEAQVRVAEAGREQVTARQELTQAQLRRARPLVPSGAISQDEFDELVAAARQAEADAFAAEASIESAKAAVTAADAAIGTSEAAVTTAQLDLDYCRVVAPIGGRVSRRYVTEGNLVSGGLGSTLLTTIVAQDPVHAYFDADEQALLKYIRLAQYEKRASSRDVKTPVYMALGDEEGYPHQGYIDFVENRVDAQTGSIRARAIFPNTDDTLVPGLFVRMQIPGSGAEERLLLPDAAIVSDQASKIVYVVGEGGKVEVRAVKTGSLSKGLRVVTEGLDGSENVVVKGVQRCRPGATVAPKVEELAAGEGNGLPDAYEPVPPERWLRQPVGPSPEGPTVSGEAPL